jgi:glycine/D-amino acid oxidase-like deaminating enzyme
MVAPLWWDGDAHRARTTDHPPDAADVCVVGGGFTGLWTAYYLLGLDPGLRVVVLEAEHVGHGASGRNGGWVSALWPVSPEAIAARHGRAAALALVAAAQHTVDEVGRVIEDEGIDCGFAKGGALVLARSAAQAERAREGVRASTPWRTDTRWLDRDEAMARLAGSSVHGGTYTPHCARVHPKRLVDGVAAAVRRRGGTVAEGQRVMTVRPGEVRLESGAVVRGGAVVRATEAYTARLPGLRRRLAPVYSLMVATEALPSHVWDEIGLSEREVFSDHRHVVVYGQRTVDDRIAFGGRGAPYHLASRVRPGYDEDARVFDRLRAELVRLLPQVEGVRFTHAWGGPLGIARDWHPSVGFDTGARVGWAGGYVGDGVAASNLAGRTLADLVTGRSSDLTRLPWVGHRSPSWEPEPLRWLGINGGLRMARVADAEERATGRPARTAHVLDALTGGE